MRILITIVTLVLLNAPLFAGDEHAHHAPADARLEFLKSLEGRWAGPAPGGAEGESVFEFRVTAGGTAVEEREFVGSDHEMMTVYYMDGDELMATHYCMLGNRPVARAAKMVKKGSLRFDCAGTPGNSASHDEQHIHGWSIVMGEDGSLQYDAALVTKGEVTEKPSFALKRVSRQAAR